MKCDVVFKFPAGLSQGVTVLVQTDKDYGETRDPWAKHLIQSQINACNRSISSNLILAI